MLQSLHLHADICKRHQRLVQGSCHESCQLADRSDVDMSLAARGHAPLAAFVNKTIWITGASQVRLAGEAHHAAQVLDLL